MNYSNKIWTALLAQTLIVCTLTGCGSTADNSGNSTESVDLSDSTTSGTVTYLDTSDMFTDRDKEIGYDLESSVLINLEDNNSTASGSSVQIAGDLITITKEGTYLLSGSLSDGQIAIDAAEDAKIQLVLDNADITCDSSAAVYVKQADKVFITTAADSTNVLTNTSEYVAIDDNNIDAVIFAKCDVTLNGSGTLDIQSAYGHGIVSKDDLVITSGTYQVDAAGHALSGKDSVRIAGGALTLIAGTDGIHSENTDTADKGFVYVSGGDLQITCESDGIDGDYTVQLDGGSFTIAAKDDGIHSDSDLIITGGDVTITESYEGLEGKTITLAGGNIDVTSSDDGINAAGEGKVLGTDTTDTASASTDSSATTPQPEEAVPDADTDNGQTPREMPDTDNGQTPPKMSNTDGEQPTELPAGGFDGEKPERGTMPENGSGSDGSAQAPANTDEGRRGSGFDKGSGGKTFGGRDGGGAGGFGGATDYNLITISGGCLHINAGGDGIDSNGNLTITGGEIYVSGPTNSGNGLLDYAGSGTISGGTFVAVGTSGMAMNFGTDSTQGAMLVTVSNYVSGTVTLTDADGNVLVSYEPDKEYNSVLISCAQLAEGETYTLTTGDTTTTVEMTSLIYGTDSMGGQKGRTFKDKPGSNATDNSTL